MMPSERCFWPSRISFKKWRQDISWWHHKNNKSSSLVYCGLLDWLQHWDGAGIQTTDAPTCLKISPVWALSYTLGNSPLQEFLWQPESSVQSLGFDELMCSYYFHEQPYEGSLTAIDSSEVLVLLSAGESVFNLLNPTWFGFLINLFNNWIIARNICNASGKMLANTFIIKILVLKHFQACCLQILCEFEPTSEFLRR